MRAGKEDHRVTRAGSSDDFYLLPVHLHGGGRPGGAEAFERHGGKGSCESAGGEGDTSLATGLARYSWPLQPVSLQAAH